MEELHRSRATSKSRADAVYDLFLPPTPTVGQITKGHDGTRKGRTTRASFGRGDVQQDRYLNTRWLDHALLDTSSG